MWLGHLPESARERRVRGHTMCLPHLPPVLYRLFNKDVVGPGIVGPDAKATGPRPARHLSGPDGAQHDACADTRYARKNRRRARDITHLTTVHAQNERTRKIQGRIIFMSMFNDIIWRIQDNEKECTANSTLMSLFAKKIQQDIGHSSDLDQKQSDILLRMKDRKENGTESLN